ncbi:MAG: hypothetical protein AAFV93_19865, partial [Chloroflexota bacterium]
TGKVTVTHFAGDRSVEHTLETRSYFGEAYVFEDVESDFRALAISETIILRLGYDPLQTLIKKDLTLSYNIVRNLSQAIKAKNDEIASLTRTHSRGMHQIFDKIDS